MLGDGARAHQVKLRPDRRVEPDLWPDRVVRLDREGRRQLALARATAAI